MPIRWKKIFLFTLFVYEGGWVVKKVQKSVYVVIECPPRTAGATMLEMGLILSSHTISMMNCSKLIAIKTRFKINRAPMIGVHGTCPCFVWCHVHHLKGKNSAKINAGIYIRMVYWKQCVKSGSSVYHERSRSHNGSEQNCLLLPFCCMAIDYWLGN